MSRKKKHAEHANHERWLVSYADFITLLFAVFVVMFSASQVDEAKAGRLAMAMQVAFQELGVFGASNTSMPLSNSAAMPFEEAQLTENVDRSTTLGRLVPQTSGQVSNLPGGGTLGNLQRELEKVLAPEIRRREVALKARRRSLVISLREIGFFDSGSAALRPESEAPLARIAATLAPRTNHLRIEGHTDNVPIHTQRFASNWELSTARATEIIKLLMTRYRLAPERLSAAGYAEFHPVARNDIPQERALNRRVDIVIVAALNEQNLAVRAAGPELPTAEAENGGERLPAAKH